MLGKFVDYFSSIWANITGALNQLDFQSIAIGLGATIIATLILVVLFQLIRRVFDGIKRRISSLKGTRIRAFRVQRQEILSDDRMILALEDGELRLVAANYAGNYWVSNVVEVRVF